LLRSRHQERPHQSPRGLLGILISLELITAPSIYSLSLSIYFSRPPLFGKDVIVMEGCTDNSYPCPCPSGFRYQYPSTGMKAVLKVQYLNLCRVDLVRSYSFSYHPHDHL